MKNCARPIFCWIKCSILTDAAQSGHWAIIKISGMKRSLFMMKLQSLATFTGASSAGVTNEIFFYPCRIWNWTSIFICRCCSGFRILFFPCSSIITSTSVIIYPLKSTFYSFMQCKCRFLTEGQNNKNVNFVQVWFNLSLTLFRTISYASKP